jgi:hypothetical protein
MQGDSNHKWAYEAAKWGADFMARSVEEHRVLLHIGDVPKDHNYLGRAEDYPQIDRNIRFCDTGADLGNGTFVLLLVPALVVSLYLADLHALYMPSNAWRH